MCAFVSHHTGLRREAGWPVLHLVHEFHASRSGLTSLRGGPVAGVAAWMQQLDLMEHNGVKAEIEAAYLHSGFGTFARDLASRLAAHLII